MKRILLCMLMLICVINLPGIASSKYANQLYKMEEIKTFLSNKDELKRIVELTKTTDMHYFEKRPQCKDYNPKCVYNFETWKHLMNEQIRAAYLDLHNDLLYTKQQQNFDEAINTFSEINKILLEIGE